LLGWVQAARYLNHSVLDLIEREEGQWWRDEAIRMLQAEQDAQPKPKGPGLGQG
jgi:hypothetical protein